MFRIDSISFIRIRLGLSYRLIRVECFPINVRIVKPCKCIIELSCKLYVPKFKSKLSIGVNFVLRKTRIKKKKFQNIHKFYLSFTGFHLTKDLRTKASLSDLVFGLCSNRLRGTLSRVRSFEASSGVGADQKKFLMCGTINKIKLLNN